MARSVQWKLIMRDGKAVELYDLASDPLEFENRFADPACVAIQEDLHQQLAERFNL
jgi:hypothetical protein